MRMTIAGSQHRHDSPTCGGSGIVVGTISMLSVLLFLAAAVACRRTLSTTSRGPNCLHVQHPVVRLSGIRPIRVVFLDHQH